MNIKNLPFTQARNYRRGRGRTLQLIVVHSMESAEKGNTAENVASYFAGANAPMASAHYCVDADSIVQCVRLDDTAYHCKNANANGIGIEHAGYAKQSPAEWLDEYGQKMLELSAELTASLCHQFNIPVRRAKFAGKNNPQVIETGICGHADVPLHGTHWDPGSGFPWDFYLERVQEHFDGTKLSGKVVGSPAIQQGAELIQQPSTDMPAPEQAQPAPSILQSDLLNTPKQIIKDKSGNLMNWLVGAGTLSTVGAWLKDNQTLIVVSFISLVVVVLAIYFVNKYFKILEARYAADKTKHDIQFVKAK